MRKKLCKFYSESVYEEVFIKPSHVTLPPLRYRDTVLDYSVLFAKPELLESSNCRLYFVQMSDSIKWHLSFPAGRYVGHNLFDKWCH